MVCTICHSNVGHLVYPSLLAISSADALLRPLWQWKTMLSSSFPGAFASNKSLKCCEDSFNDCSRLSTARRKYIFEKWEKRTHSLHTPIFYWDCLINFSCHSRGMLTDPGMRPAWNSSGLRTSNSWIFLLYSIDRSCSYDTTESGINKEIPQNNCVLQWWLNGCYWPIEACWTLTELWAWKLFCSFFSQGRGVAM